MSAGYISYMSVYSLTVWRLWVCSISACLMPKFEMSVCRMSVINVCLWIDCVALISFLWCDLLSWMPLCGISVCWMAEFSFCPTTGCFTMRCHCLRWLCARCLCYGFISGVSVLYVRVYNVCLQDIYPRCLCIRWLCGGCGCAASLCV